MKDNAGEQKRPGKLRALAIGERFVLVSLADHDEPPSSVDDSAVCNDEALSAAERAVAQLAARGLTNSEIARARNVAPRTISNQLAGVYRKLGVSGRRELRAWFRGHRAGNNETTP